MAKGKKRAGAAPPYADSNKDKQKQHPGAERDVFSLEAQSVPADAPKPKQGEWCWDVAFQLAQFQDIIERHSLRSSQDGDGCKVV